MAANGRLSAEILSDATACGRMSVTRTRSLDFQDSSCNSKLCRAFINRSSASTRCADSFVTIRRAQDTDALAIGDLSEELGYAAKRPLVLRNLTYLLSSAEHAVFVFEHETIGVVGWIHVQCSHRIESAAFAEIGGLVVSKELRRQGIASALVSATEGWARSKGLAKLRVRCNELRKDSITFYQNAGFESVKGQRVLDRCIET